MFLKYEPKYLPTQQRQIILKYLPKQQRQFFYIFTMATLLKL